MAVLRAHHRLPADAHEQYVETRDEALRAALVERYAPLAGRLAARFGRTGNDRDDLRQVAMLGLVKALDRFDPAKGVKFTTFAWATISGELKRYRRDCEWTVHVPRGVQERYLEVAAAVEELPVELGREPTTADIADRTGHSLPAVRECLQIRESNPLSLDSTGDPESAPAPAIGAVDPAMERLEERDALTRALRRLPADDRQVLILHYVDGFTQTEIADHLGGSQMKVSRTLARSRDRLRSILAPRPPAAAPA